MNDIELMVTLWPSFPHFPRFTKDSRLSGIRLNSAMMTSPELDKELKLIDSLPITVPLWFDVKGRQLRVTKVHDNPDYLDLTLNHPISVETPVMVLFKAEADRALLERVEEDGRRLIFQGGPKYMVYPGESLHIRHPSLCVQGPIFIDAELAKIEKVKKAGFTRFFLSYVESQQDVDEFQELVGKDSELLLKIETQKGLDFVANEFQKRPNISLVAARGDLYVEIDRPHQIMDALKLIIEKDPKACVASRILLSVVSEPIPSCADFLELAWLYDIGYRSMMLCDELCLKEELLATAMNAFESFKDAYVKKMKRFRVMSFSSP